MLASQSLGVFLSLVAALIWGGGDFSGGLAARRARPFQVLALSAVASVAFLLLLSIFRGEALPSRASLLWAALAGVSGALGLAALYRGLAVGSAAVVAPTAGVIGAGLPVLVGLLTEGLPALTQAAGFLVALTGIALVTRSSHEDGNASQGFTLAVLAGIGFGGFLAMIAQVDSGELFAPLVASKLASLGVACLIIRVRRQPLPHPQGHPFALLAGVLDAGGNIFYLAANQFARLDTVAILASLYPAGTVIFSRLIIDEHMTLAQSLGVGLCLAAIVLISL